MKLFPFYFGVIILLIPATLISQPAESVVIKPKDTPELNESDFFPKPGPVKAAAGSSFNVINQIQSQPEAAFLSSIILPGSSQAINQNWIRAGLFAVIEAGAIILAADRFKKASRLENRYEYEANQNWSVVQYAQWLIDYHEVHNLPNPHLNNLRDEVADLTPTFDTDIEWNAVDINILRNAERSTRYLTTDDRTANNFSHTLPAYGSQQYYELIAKYYQYQAGWRDYHGYHDQLGHTGNEYEQRFLFERSGAYASPLFWQFAANAERFNDLYRSSRSFRTAILVNHIASAFDALFTVQLKQNRIEATPSIAPGRQISMSVRF